MWENTTSKRATLGANVFCCEKLKLPPKRTHFHDDFHSEQPIWRVHSEQPIWREYWSDFVPYKNRLSLAGIACDKVCL